MPALTLPPSFANSFWSQDYRRGLEVLYDKLEQGIAENLEVFKFIKARAFAENEIANTLCAPAPTGARGTGFDNDDGASLFMAFRALQSESVKQGEVHKAVAHELATLVADPFGEWAAGYAHRIQESRKVIIDGWLAGYEVAISDVNSLKQNYLTRSRRADEAEDDAKFAPGTDKYTSPTKIGPSGGIVKRTASVSERIATRLKELRNGGQSEAVAPENKLSPVSPVFSAGKSEGDNEHTMEELPLVPSKDKGKGKEIPVSISPANISPSSPPLPLPLPTVVIPSSMTPTQPSPLVLGGLSLSPQDVSQLLTRAASELPLRSIRFPILGEYQDCFSGEEFVTWLKESVQGFGGNLDRAEEAARQLAEREGVLRRIGELGNKFDNSKTAYYQFRQKAFELHIVPEPAPLDQQGPLSPVAENLMKRTNTFVSIVSKAVGGGTSEPPHLRARHDAEDADKLYHAAIRKVDRHRLGLEEKIEETLKSLQKWETERLRAVQTVLLQYQGTLANIPTTFSSSIERSSILISSYQPESDLVALIERYRTGPFRPKPHIYESVTRDQPDVVFGIDLRKWAGEGGWHAVRAKDDQKEQDKLDAVPNIVTGLLAGLSEAYEKLPNDSERRKTWIYDVPLPVVHHLRESINTLSPNATLSSDLLAKYDAPVLASTLKLWVLELDPPLGLWEGWEDVRKLYPSVGAVAGAEVPEQQRVDDIQVTLLKLPKIHLLVLDTIIAHLRNLIDTTHEVDETSEVYITKLALSLGRTILRPKVENGLSIQDRHPTLLFIDLVKHYADILPKTISRKRRESMERPIPTRKRTKMVDQRLSRSRISFGADPQQLLAAQHAAQHGPTSRSASPTGSRLPPSEPAVPSIEPSGFPPASPPAPLVPPSPPTVPVPPAPPAPSMPAVEASYVPPPRPTFAEFAEEGILQHPEPVHKDDESGAILSPPTSEVPPSEGSPPPEIPMDKPPVGLSRSGSTGVRVRGPRGARPVAQARPASRSPPRRTFGTSGATSLTSQPAHSRGPSSSSATHISVDPAQYAPKKHGGRANAAIFSRRTQASDAEDNVLDK